MLPCGCGPKINPVATYPVIAIPDRSKCDELLEEYQDYWVKDSLGIYGFRSLFATEFLSQCYFTNDKWSRVKKYFGKPNYIYKRDDSILYRYRLSYFSEGNFDAPGNRFLDIEVSGDIILLFKAYEIDG